MLMWPPCLFEKCMDITEQPTRYGKRLNQLSTEEMRWWRKNAFHPVIGGVYICRRGSKEYNTVAGRIYVFEGFKLHTYTSRNMKILLDGYNILRQPYAFHEYDKCPICDCQVFDPFGAETVVHNVIECARK